MWDFERSICSCYRNGPRLAPIFGPPYHLILPNKLGQSTESLPALNSNSYICNCFKCSSHQHIFSHLQPDYLAYPADCTPHLLALGQTIYKARRTLSCGCPFGLSDPETPSLLLRDMTSAHMPSHGFLSLDFLCPVPLLGTGPTPWIWRSCSVRGSASVAVPS